MRFSLTESGLNNLHTFKYSSHSVLFQLFQPTELYCFLCLSRPEKFLNVFIQNSTISQSCYFFHLVLKKYNSITNGNWIQFSSGHSVELQIKKLALSTTVLPRQFLKFLYKLFHMLLIELLKIFTHRALVNQIVNYLSFITSTAIVNCKLSITSFWTFNIVYSIILWGSSSQCTILQIFKLQKRATRIMAEVNRQIFCLEYFLSL